MMLGSITEAREALRISNPYETAVAFGILALLHVRGFIVIFYDSSKAIKRRKSISQDSEKEPQNKKNWIISMFEKYLGDDGVYGRRGGKFEVFLMLTEGIEIPSQSYQAFLMCQQVPDGNFALIYASIIFADCLLVPIIMNVRNMETLRRRNSILVVDLLVDTTLGAIFPLTTAVPAAQAYLKNPGIKTSIVWFGETLSSTQYFMISSPVQLFVAAVPLLFSHLLIDTIHCNWCDIARKIKIRPTNTENYERQEVPSEQTTMATAKSRDIRSTFATSARSLTLSHIERIFSSIILVWGICLMYFVVVARFRPTCTSAFAKAACKAKTHPWFAENTDCFCLVIDMDCSIFDPVNNQTSFTNYNDALNQTFVSSAPLVVHVKNCNLKEAPKALETYSSMFELRIKHCNVESYQLDFQHHKSLFLLHLNHVPLKEVPLALHQLPKGLYFFGLDHTNIREFPVNVVSSWKGISSLALAGNSLHDIPRGVYELEQLREIFIYSNHIETIPNEVSKLQQLSLIDIANNSLISIFPQINSVTKLNWVSVEMNNLNDLPWTAEQIKNWKGTLKLDYNPICKVSHSMQIHNTTSCTRSCSPRCDDKLLDNFRCDDVCDTAQCDYDNGFCLSS